MSFADDVDPYTLASFALTCVSLGALVLTCLPLMVLARWKDASGRADLLRTACYIGAVFMTLVSFVLYIADIVVSYSSSEQPASFSIIIVFLVITGLFSALFILAVMIRYITDQNLGLQAIGMFSVLALLIVLALVQIGLEGAIINNFIQPSSAYSSGYSPTLDSAFNGTSVAWSAIFLLTLLAIGVIYIVGPSQRSTQRRIPFMVALVIFMLLTILNLVAYALILAVYDTDTDTSYGSSESVSLYESVISGPVNVLQVLVLVLLGADGLRAVHGARADVERPKQRE